MPDPTDADRPNTDALGPTARQEEFVRLYSCHVDRLQAYLGALLPQAADVDDVFQQTSLTLWRKFDEFRPDGDFAAWACGIAFNLARNFRRAENRRPVLLLDDDLLELIGQTHLGSTETLSDRRVALADCMEKLTPDERTLVDRSYDIGANVAEIAAEMGQTPNAIYKRLKSIRRQLFDCVNRTLATEGSSQ